MVSNIPSLKRAYTGSVFKLNNEIKILTCIKYYATLHCFLKKCSKCKKKNHISFISRISDIFIIMTKWDIKVFIKYFDIHRKYFFFFA